MINRETTLGDPEQLTVQDRNLRLTVDHLKALNAALGRKFDDMFEYWISRVPTWEVKGKKVSILEFARKFGYVPREAEPRAIISQYTPDGKRKSKATLVSERYGENLRAATKYAGKLEQWMAGGNSEVAGNQLIFNLSTLLIYAEQYPSKFKKLVEKASLDGVKDYTLQSIIGANSRLRYSRAVKKLQSKIITTPGDSPEQKRLKEKLSHLLSPIGIEKFHLRSVHRQEKYWREIRDNSPKKYVHKLEELRLNSYRSFHSSAAKSTVHIGRADRKFFDLGVIDIGWLQAWMQEEPNGSETALKGFTILFVRKNPNDGANEMLVGFGKRDSYSATDHLTATLQTSISNPDLSIVLKTFIDAMKRNENLVVDPNSGGIVYNEEGIPAICASMGGRLNNENRLIHSPTGQLVINLDAFPVATQEYLLKYLNEKASKPIKLPNGTTLSPYIWITDAEFDALDQIGLFDVNHDRRPITNPFLAQTLPLAHSLRRAEYAAAARKAIDFAKQNHFPEEVALGALTKLETFSQIANENPEVALALFSVLVMAHNNNNHSVLLAGRRDLNLE